MPPEPQIGSSADLIGRVEQTTDQLAAIPDEVNGALFAIRNDDGLSDSGRADAVRQLRDQETARVQQLRTTAAETLERARTALTVEARQTAGTTSEQLLTEQREARGWDRARRALEAGTRPRDLIDQATADGDVATLRALRVELVPWLRAEVSAAGAETGGRAATALAAATGEDGSSLIDAIDQALIDLFPARTAAPYRNRRRLELATERLQVEGEAAALATSSATSPTQRISFAYRRTDLDRRRNG